PLGLRAGTARVGAHVQKVTAAVSQMLRTGMAQSAEEAFDIVVKATQNGINKSEDLIDTINEYSTHFRSLGLTGEQALGLIQQALQAGARDSDYAADAIKEFQINAVVGSDDVVKALKEMGLSADELVKKIAEGGPGAARPLTRSWTSSGRSRTRWSVTRSPWSCSAPRPKTSPMPCLPWTWTRPPNNSAISVARRRAPAISFTRPRRTGWKRSSARSSRTLSISWAGRSSQQSRISLKSS